MKHKQALTKLDYLERMPRYHDKNIKKWAKEIIDNTEWMSYFAKLLYKKKHRANYDKIIDIIDYYQLLITASRERLHDIYSINA